MGEEVQQDWWGRLRQTPGRVCKCLWLRFCPEPINGWQIFSALFRSGVLWFGEVVVSFFPLIAHIVVSKYSKHDFLDGHAKILTSIPLEELNIATMVLSGLAILTVFKPGIEGSGTSVTPLTYIAALVTIILLISSSLLYAVASIHMSIANEEITYALLVLAVIMSLALTLEQSWLKAVFNHAE